MNTDKKANWSFPVVIPSNPVKKIIKTLIGKLVQVANPDIRRELLAGKIPENSMERAALTSIFIELKEKNQVEKLAELHKKIWSSDHTQGYYDLTSSRLRGMFERMKDAIFSTLATLLKDKNYQELVELGCGEGVIMSTLSEKYKNDIPSFTGVDINEGQIELNKSVYSSIKNLRFQTADLTQQIHLIKGPNKIFLTFGGVLEYLTEKEIQSLFKELSSFENSAIIIYEPVKAGFDPKTEQHSILYGSEFSFTHPYYYYLSTCGFNVIGEELVESGDTNWLYLAATTN